MNDAFARLTAALADRYRLERELGQGGMATVYRAQDLKHDRKVAIKVLRPELAAVIGAERFLREIKTIATLQHPHILGLIDSGQVEGTAYFVMPFVEGESLRDRLSREKQLPIHDAVRIATEVAAALDYAHRHGVIHRDIKPENIMLHDGSALVADFGIALAVSSAGGTRMTETGMSLGTPHYMSPEQAMGEREITARSDVYALGAMTYEMLVGEPPFTGPTAQAIVAKVMTAEPAGLIAQRKSVPEAVEDAVLTALAKLPADRFGSAAEFGEALSGARAATRRGASATRAAARGANASSWRRAAIGFAAAAVLAAALAAWGWLRPPAPRPFPSRLAIPVPGLGGSGGPALQRQLTLTRDGTTLVYVVVSPDGANRLLRHPLDASEGTVIAGSDGMASPAVSPDGQWVLGTRWAQGSFRLPLGGGTRIPLPASIRVIGFADWDESGSLWIEGDQTRQRGVARIGIRDSLEYLFGEAPRDVQFQQLLPGGRQAVGVRKGLSSITGPVEIMDTRNGSSRVIIERPILEVRYTTGYLVLLQLDGTLQAVPFDLAGGRPVGGPVTIATGVSVTGNGFGQIAVARNGTIAYIPEEPRSLVFIQRDGNSREPIAARHSYHAPMFSPDGRRVATDFITGEGRDTWVLSLDQGTLTRATFQRDGHDATWTADGRHLTYSSVRGSALGVFRTRPGSAVDAESLFASPALAYTGLWLPDGSGLVTVATGLNGSSGSDVALLKGQGRGPLTPLVASQFEESYPAVSPDGRWLAFVSNQSGRQEVYVRPLGGEGDQVQVSLAGATEPLWSRDGRELFYRSTEADSRLVSAAVRTTPIFEVVSRRPLFPMGDIVGTNPHTNYDISPDGRTFAMVRRSPSSRIVVIQNLPGLVERLQGAAGGPR